MRKSLLSLIAIAAIIFAASCSKDDSSVSTDGKMGSVTATFTFSEAGGTRAPLPSNAIPVTSWSNISQINFVLYNSTTNVVVYSKVIDPSTLSGTTKTVTWTDVPVNPTGQSYTLALIANVQQGTNAVRTFFGNEQQVWSDAYMYSKNVSQFRVDYPTSTQPSGSTVTKTWLGQPAEVFSAYATGIDVQKDQVTTVSNLELKRDVSMMRIRLNQKDADPGSDNTDVNFNDDDAYIRIDRLSDGMKITSAVNVFGAGNGNFAMNAAEGADAFRNASYSLAGYSSNNSDPAKIVGLGDNYDLWNDIIIFPNVARQDDGDYSAIAATDNKYFIVVAGMAAAGHVLSDGTPLTNPAVVYWSGVIDGPFINNVIREVNLRLATGGTTTEPTEPPVYGGLKIEVGEPMDWDSNIQVENIDL